MDIENNDYSNIIKQVTKIWNRSCNWCFRLDEIDININIKFLERSNELDISIVVKDIQETPFTFRYELYGNINDKLVIKFIIDELSRYIKYKVGIEYVLNSKHNCNIIQSAISDVRSKLLLLSEKLKEEYNNLDNLVLLES